VREPAAVDMDICGLPLGRLKNRLGPFFHTPKPDITGRFVRD
jgi:hypothetical protein